MLELSVFVLLLNLLSFSLIFFDENNMTNSYNYKCHTLAANNNTNYSFYCENIVTSIKKGKHKFVGKIWSWNIIDNYAIADNVDDMI